MRFIELIYILIVLFVLYFLGQYARIIFFEEYKLPRKSLSIKPVEYNINMDAILEDIINIRKIMIQSDNYEKAEKQSVSFEKSKSGDVFFGTVFYFHKDYIKNKNEVVLNINKNEALPEFKKQCILLFKNIDIFNDNSKNYKIIVNYLKFPEDVYKYNNENIPQYCDLFEKHKSAYLAIKRVI